MCCSSRTSRSTSSERFQEGVVARYRDLGDEWGLARAEWSFAVIAMSKGDVEEADAARRGPAVPAARRPPVPRDDQCEPRLGLLHAGGHAERPVCGRRTRRDTRDARPRRRRDLAARRRPHRVDGRRSRMRPVCRGRSMASATDMAFSRRRAREFIGDIDPLGPARRSEPEAFAAAFEVGRQLTLDDAVALVLELGAAAGARGAGRPLDRPRIVRRHGPPTGFDGSGVDGTPPKGCWPSV